jgi:2-oxoglutarate ferredoxin oxidoreductase subunit beta
MSPPVKENPVNKYLRMERMPSIWCPGCGIGTTVNCFARALDESEMDLNKVAVVSGIGCTGRVAGYMNVDSFHTTPRPGHPVRDRSRHGAPGHERDRLLRRR